MQLTGDVQGALNGSACEIRDKRTMIPMKPVHLWRIHDLVRYVRYDKGCKVWGYSGVICMVVEQVEVSLFCGLWIMQPVAPQDNSCCCEI